MSLTLGSSATRVVYQQIILNRIGFGLAEDWPHLSVVGNAVTLAVKRAPPVDGRSLDALSVLKGEPSFVEVGNVYAHKSDVFLWHERRHSEASSLLQIHNSFGSLQWPSHWSSLTEVVLL